MKDYAALLKESGLKATFQRMNILEVIDQNGHMSIDDIYETLIKIHPSLSLATIYKNIITMQEQTLFGEVEDKNCLETTDAMLNALAEESQFLLKRRQVNLYGKCHRCSTI